MDALTGIPAALVFGTFVAVILIASVIGCANPVVVRVKRTLAAIYGALKTVAALFVSLAFSRAHELPVACLMTEAGNPPGLAHEAFHAAVITPGIYAFIFDANAGLPLCLAVEPPVALTNTVAPVFRAYVLVVAVLVCSAFRPLIPTPHHAQRPERQQK
jgi:hypothetical protein